MNKWAKKLKIIKEELIVLEIVSDKIFWCKMHQIGR